MSRPAQLSPEATMLYRLAVRDPYWTREKAAEELGRSLPEIDELITLLLSLELFRKALEPGREFDAVGPQAAVAKLLIAAELDIQQRQAEVATVRDELMSLVPTYFDARRQRRRVEAVDVVEDVEMVRELLVDHARHAEKEICIAHPGGGMDEAGIDRSLALDIPMLQRGISMRSVLQHSTRRHRPTWRYVEEVSRLGADVRTVPIVPRRLIIFDREVAFIPTEGGSDAKGAVIVREPATLESLLAFFDLVWRGGKPFLIGEANDLAEIEHDVHMAIIRQMAAGAKDELIAHRMGISLRTCRRYIATIINALGARSRFQAGILTQQRGLLE
jgi:hypothetical protein